MGTQVTRAKYEAPKLEVQRLRDLPSALAHSANVSGHSNGHSNGHDNGHARI